MRIGVLTHSFGDDNYGQILQCYALQQYLKRRGYDPFLIQYEVENNASPDHFVLFKNVLRRIAGIISPSRKKAYAELELIKKQRAVNANRNKERRFHQFKHENIELSCFYSNFDELQNNPPEADAYIVGSDQVWNLSVNSDSALAWYLQFGSKEIKRISYAASFGRELNENEYEKFRLFLDEFSAISVREAGALECCKRAGVKNVRVVLDPTLLVTEEMYRPFLQSDYAGKPYLFLYYLNVINKDDLAWHQIESYIMEKDLELKSVSSSGYYPAFDLIPGHDNLLLTIPEWINTVYHSSYVVTTSFHGVALAILMHRPFVAILLKGTYCGGNNRINDLLGSLGLSGRILTGEHTIGEILETQIDWGAVDLLLEEQRKVSEEFLQEALTLEKC